MTGNNSVEVSLDYSSAILGDRDITEGERREAGICLAGLALNASGGDWDAARDMLRDPLEAAGFIPYETVPTYPDGRPKRPGGKKGTAS